MRWLGLSVAVMAMLLSACHSRSPKTETTAGERVDRILDAIDATASNAAGTLENATGSPSGRPAARQGDGGRRCTGKRGGEAERSADLQGKDSFTCQ